jgi:hypothetical protein
VYDTLGIISPFTISTRTILRASWGENLDWDKPVLDKYITLWKVWLDGLFELPNFIKIPRHLGFGINTKIELHVFVHASTKVFVATVYARILGMREPKDFDKGVTARGENQNFFVKISLSLASKRCRAVDLVDEEMPLDKEKKVIFVINLDLLKERT